MWHPLRQETADPGGLEVVGGGLRLLDCCEHGIESRRGHGCSRFVRRVRKIAKSDYWLRHARPHETTRLPLDEFS